MEDDKVPAAAPTTRRTPWNKGKLVGALRAADCAELDVGFWDHAALCGATSEAMRWVAYGPDLRLSLVPRYVGS